MENKSISKVLHAEIKPPQKGNASGCFIKFISDDNVVKDDKVKIVFNNSPHYFNISSISITEDKKLSIEAHEVGYWARKFDRVQDFDLRSLLDLEVTLIKDTEILKNINEQSCWC